MTAPKQPPEYLTARSKALWRRIVGRFELEAQHLELLRLGLEAVDRTDQARRRLARDGLTILGPRGTLQKHPLVDVEIASRTAAIRVFRELGLSEYLTDGPPARDGKGRFAG
jgi:P27 family predicted phage terminase small subunit